MPVEVDHATIWSTVGAVIVAALGSKGAFWLIEYLRERYKQNRVLRADAIGEWEKLVSGLQSQITAQRVQLDGQNQQIIQISKDHATCLAQNQDLRERQDESRVRIEHLEQIIFQLQKGCPREKGCPLMLDPVAAGLAKPLPDTKEKP